MRRANRVLIGLLAGLVLGILVSRSPNRGGLALVDGLAPIGTLWINGVRMTVIPLVVSMLIVGLASHGEAPADDTGRTGAGGIARLGWRTLATFLALVASAGLFTMIVSPSVFSRLHVDPTAGAALRAGVSASAEATAGQVKQLPTFGQWLAALVPANVVRAAADGAMLPLIVFSLLFGLAIGRIEPAVRGPLLDFFGAIADAMMALVRWLIVIAPLGVFALIVGPAARLGVAIAGAVGYYILGISLALALFTVLLYPIAVLGGVPSARFARAVFPAQAVALSSSSSLASLPALVEGGRDRLALPPPVTGFVLPLAVATFKIATPITWTVGALFLSRLYGTPLGIAQVATVALSGTLLSFSIPGVPQGALLLLAPLLANIGLPPEGVGLLIAADTIPDLVGTMTNVTGDMVSAVLLTRWVGPMAEPHPGL